MYAAPLADEVTVVDPSARVSNADLRTPEVARTAGGILVAAGMFVLAAAAQVLALTDGALATVLAAPLALTGAAAVVVAPHVYNGRAWATFMSTGLGFAMGGAVLGWMSWSLVTLQVAPALFLAAVASLTAAIVQPFAVRPALRVSRARRALAA